MSIRKILIPVVAGCMLSPALMAADITTTSGTSPTSESDEWLSTADSADTVAGGVLSVTLGSEYAVGDIVTISFSGGALEAGILSSIPVAINGAISGITLGLLSSDADTATYRVTDIDPGTGPTTVGAVIPIALNGILIFDAPSVDAAGTITVTYSAATDTGLALDTGGGGTCTLGSGCNTVDYITTGTQYDTSVTTAFDGVIDVDDNRETFEGGVKIDILVVTNIDTGGGFTNAATLTGTGYDIVVTGDFSFLVDSDPATAGLQPITGVVTIAGGGCTGMVVTVTDVSFNCTTATGTATLTIDLTLNVSGTPPVPAILPAGAFSVTVDANFTGIGGAGSALLLSGSAGAWVLNGYQAFIPYMPYESGISQVIYLANRGAKTGDITVDWIGLNGTSGTLGVIATLGAGTTLSIGPIINAALPAAQRASSRLALTITANVPAKDVQMNSQYNVNGNRAFTLHEDNRPTPAH